MDDAAEVKLITTAQKTLREIMKKKTAVRFNEPVRPKTHGCTDYLERIKFLMDFGTMEKNIEDGQYNNAIEIVKDVRLVASNCPRYNTSSHMFSRWAADHERSMETVMKAAEESERATFLKRSNGNANKTGETTVNADGKKHRHMCARRVRIIPHTTLWRGVWTRNCSNSGPGDAQGWHRRQVISPETSHQEVGAV